MKVLFYIIVLCLGFFAKAQQEEELSEQQILTMPIDSLRNTIDRIFDDDQKTAHLYSKSYLKRSKLIENREKIADAYVFLTMSAPKSQVLTYCDSLITATKDFDTHKYPAFAHYLKAETLYGLHQYKEALTEALLANKKITSKTSKFFKYLIYNGIAAMSTNNKQHNVALTYFNKSLSYFREQDNAMYLSALFGLAESHLALKNLDSTSYFINEGFIKSKGENKFFYVYFLMTYGRLAYQQGNYFRAKDSLTKSLPVLKEEKNLPNLATNAFWLGKVEEKLGNYQSAMDYYKMVDSIFTINRTIPLEVRPAWTSLINYYNRKRNYENELKYARKLIVVDSTLSQEIGYITNEITNKFVLPSIEQENLEERQLLKKSKDRTTLWLLVLASLLSILMVLFILYRKRESKRLMDYERVIEKLKKTPNKLKSSSITLELKPELIERIEKGLELFEQSQDYLKNDVSLRSVAQKIGTNTRYLSKYVNHFKQVGFPEYLNNLRIEYVLKRLEKSYIERVDRFRIWSMSEVAKASGFGSREYYAKAFYKYTNMKHRDYLNQLEKTIKKSRNS